MRQLRCQRVVCIVAIIAAPAACMREQPAARTDTVVVPTDSANRAAAVASLRTGWPSNLGTMLVVSTDSASNALVVIPSASDSTLETAAIAGRALKGTRITLLSATGVAGTGVLTPAPPDSERTGCTAWPSMRVANRSNEHPWQVGFVGSAPAVIALAPVRAADSTNIENQLVLLAHALPFDTSMALRGVPFAIRTVSVAALGPGDTAYVAVIERQLNVEAMPVTEEIFLVAQRDSVGVLEQRYVERASGSEEEVEATDPLLLFRAAPGEPARMLIHHDFGDGGTFAILRDDPQTGRWVPEWSSAYTGC